MARKCPTCDSARSMVRFRNEAFDIEHQGTTAKVAGLSGWRCDACGEVEFDAASA